VKQHTSFSEIVFREILGIRENKTTIAKFSPLMFAKDFIIYPRTVRSQINCGRVSARQRSFVKIPDDQGFLGNTAGAMPMNREQQAVSQKNYMYDILFELCVWWVSLSLGGIPLCYVC
jgi:hypothetical protein